MTNLFGEEEKAAPVTSLKITPQGKKVLSKEQQQFNRLNKRIENLEKEIIAEHEKLNRILELYSGELHPLRLSVAQKRTAFAITLGKATKIFKFGKRQLGFIQSIILDQFDEAFAFITPTKEQESFYDEWSDISYQEEIEHQKGETQTYMTEQLKQMGITIDLSDIDESPEGFARLQEKLRSEMERLGSSFQQNHRKRKKSVQQSLREQRQKEEEELKNKSIRSIYISLVKVMHPDLESSPALKKEKEDIMKQITTAYENKDLLTLLKLEMQWMQKENSHLAQLAEEKLKLYNMALKEQVAALEQEKFMAQQHPRFIPISKYVHATEKTAVRQIQSETNALKIESDLLDQYMIDFEKPDAKPKIAAYIKQYYDRSPYDRFPDFAIDWRDSGF